MSWRLLLVVIGLAVGIVGSARAQDKTAQDKTAQDKTAQDKTAQDKTAPAAAGAKTIEQLVEAARPSLVIVHHTGREGKRDGLGAGFVVSADGLIATNLHVIGDGRPITVQLADGSQHDVVSVHASDRGFDLALIKINAKKLRPLPLGDAQKLKVGQPIAALGHPLGLEHSVVAGVLSGRRELEGIKMLQIAMPIEQGNSGGPVLDMEGHVVGIVTMKSMLAANLGFAVPVDSLKTLIQRPNPVPMERWLTIGVLDKGEWQTIYGGRWRQRAGRIIGDGVGTGFGGRSLCLSQRPAPKVPYEIAVTVKLDDESGAAGLIFGGDERDKHFGFYPTGGKLRLTRFNGPDVFSWKILKDTTSPHYRPGEWNDLRVRVEADKFLCYVNDQLIVEWGDVDFAGSKVGLAKFRETTAEFKRFQVGARLASQAAAAELQVHIKKAIAGLADKGHSAGELSPGELAPLVQGGAESMLQLRARARQLETQAEQLRKLASQVHHERTLGELKQAVHADDAKSDLWRAALLIAKLDNEELDVEAYRGELERLTRAVAEKLPKDATPEDRVAALNRVLFEERGFHGSRMDYYARSNSYLNEVIDDREGIPITLSVLYLELGRRLGLKMVGVGLPGHFVVRHEPPAGPDGDAQGKGKGQLIDVYDGGKTLSDEEAAARVRKITGVEPEMKHFAAASKKAILMRMLTNLINIAGREKDLGSVLRYLDAILVIEPEAYEERWARAVFRWQAGRREGAAADCDWLIERSPPGVDLERVRELRRLAHER